jgi:hypothetical protein
MVLPKNIRTQFLARFDELITEGKEIAHSIVVIPPHTRGNVSVLYTQYNWDPQRLGRWKTNCLALLDPFAKQGTKLKEQADRFSKATGKKPEVEYCLGVLEAFRDSLEKGFLDDLVLKVEAEIAADYMAQAEGLLQEGQEGKFDHVPAAVLAGAVLEKSLRTLCSQQQPPIPTVNANGEPKTLNPLIDELKKVNVFNKLKAKHLRGVG